MGFQLKPSVCFETGLRSTESINRVPLKELLEKFCEEVMWCLGQQVLVEVLPLFRTVGEFGPADCFLQPRQF